jgi:hypothetical protein
MRTGLGLTLVAAMLAGACGGGSKSPAAPSAATAPGTTASGSTAIITGSVQGATTSALTAASNGYALTGVTVTVVGTNITASVDVGGRFTLMNVPVGTVQLQLTGGGANATITLGTVEPSQTVDVVIAVAGTSGSVESEVRSGAGEAQLEGRVESLPPTVPAQTFKAAGRSVKTDSSTRFLDGSQTRAFADLKVGMRIHARGTLSGDQFTAAIVELQNSNTALPVEVNGVIDTLTGTASAFQFNIGSRVIKGDAQTTFFGSGDRSTTFSALKNGVRAEVKGEQRDGFVQATRLHVEDGNDNDNDDDQDASASIDGRLNAMSGAKPTFTLTVGTTTVRTSSSTEVKRKGDVQALDQLKIGQTLHVVGTRQSNGSIDARKIEIEDDDDGGEFEIEGSVGGLSGSCPAIQFGVNGFAIKASTSTTFEDGACSGIKSGTRVQVEGLRQADGSVNATSTKPCASGSSQPREPVPLCPRRRAPLPGATEDRARCPSGKSRGRSPGSTATESRRSRTESRAACSRSGK